MRARLKVSRAGVELIKSFEGLRQTAARLPDGRWTLGYGHTFSARDGARVTPEDAEALLRFDLLPIVDGLNNTIVVPLNQYQFDALVSFCFNIGIENFLTSNVLKRINEGRLMEAALAMESWRSAEFGGQTYVLAPLIRRRAAEKNLFLTPVETDNTAPSMLVRPMEDPRLGLDGPASRPTELDAPLYGDRVQARPLGDPEYKSVPAYDAAIQAAPVAPVPGYGSDRSYIDLSAQPSPPQTEARAKPVIVRMADVAPEPQPAPVAEPGTVFETEPTMSPAVRAALEQAQAEADARVRAEDQRRADDIRMNEEARLREIRLAEEAQRQAQALAAARAEQEARQAQAEAALRLEAQRQEDLKREAEARQQAETAAAELAKSLAPVVSEVPTVSEIPAAPLIEVKATPSVAEPVKAEEKAGDAATPATVTPEEAKRAEAKANLMRFYSPYGASPMGKPLVPPKPVQPATQATPSAVVAPPSVAQSGPVVAPVSPTPVYPAYPPAKTPDMNPVQMNDAVSAVPGLLIDTQEPTILSPSALVPPAVFASVPQASVRPADAPLEMARSNAARQAAAEAQVNWRDKLERPLPSDFPKPATGQATPYHSPSRVFEATASDDDELWDDEHARIAMTAEHAEDDHPSLMSMVGSSVGWLISSVLGMVALAGGAAAFYKSNDPVGVREGWYGFYMHMSIVLAVVGLVLVCFSIAMILKRLGGLKD